MAGLKDGLISLLTPFNARNIALKGVQMLVLDSISGRRVGFLPLQMFLRYMAGFGNGAA